MCSKSNHIPVMINEVLEALCICDGKIFVDCTFGAGGYSKSILSKANCNIISIDQDPTTQKYADKLLEEFGDRFKYVNENFRNISKAVGNYGKVDGVVYDLGVSSMQLDERDRGFSFQQNAKLDMRMSCNGKSAYEVVNETAEAELADIIYHYGEEHASRQIARKIVEARSVAPIETTFELADIVRSVVRKKGKIDPSTKTFQAIRIAVNDELGALRESLEELELILKPKARVVIVTFHALEDRIVKKFFIDNSDPKVAKSKYSKEEAQSGKLYRFVSKKSIKPTKEEVKENPRSRSAKVRVMERV